jgi:hypothetical protein
MVDIRSKKCYCGKAFPCFNLIGLKADFYSKCKTYDMLNVKHKRKCESPTEKARKKHKYIMV